MGTMLPITPIAPMPYIARGALAASEKGGRCYEEGVADKDAR